MQDDADYEHERRQHYERNAGLRQDSGAIGNRERLPKEDAAIATLAVQRIERVKDADDECSRNEQPIEVGIRHCEHRTCRHAVMRWCAAHATQQNSQIDEKTEYADDGGG